MKDKKIFTQNLIPCLGSTQNVTTAPIQPEQRAMNAPIIPNPNCNVATVHANRVLTTHICAGSITITAPQTGACRGL